MAAMKKLLTFAFAMLASIATAQPFDQKLCTSVLFDGKPYADGCITYHGLTTQDLQFVRGKMVAVLDTASKAKDTGGPFTVVLREVVTDAATGKVSDGGDLTFPGLKLSSAAKVIRAELKAGDALHKVAEGLGDKGKDGKGKVWGK